MADNITTYIYLSDYLQDRFQMEDGITLILRNGKYVKFIDCSLKFTAEVSGAQSKDGHWLCVCKTYIHKEQLKLRYTRSTLNFFLGTQYSAVH